MNLVSSAQSHADTPNSHHLKKTPSRCPFLVKPSPPLVTTTLFPVPYRGFFTTVSYTWDYTNSAPWHMTEMPVAWEAEEDSRPAGQFGDPVSK